MPNANLAYNTSYSFKISTSNICGAQATLSPALTYTILSYVPNTAFPPTLVTAFDSLISVTWLPLTTAAQKGYHEIQSYELSYAPSTTPTVFTVLTNSLVTSFS